MDLPRFETGYKLNYTESSYSSAHNIELHGPFYARRGGSLSTKRVIESEMRRVFKVRGGVVQCCLIIGKKMLRITIELKSD